MKIVIATEWLAENMGYADICLAKALAKRGCEVHILTSNVKPYFNLPNYRETYEDFLGTPIVSPGVATVDGYTIHRLQHRLRNGQIFIPGLLKEMKSIRPDIVQAFDVYSPLLIKIITGKLLFPYKIFTASHIHASVYPLAHAKKNDLGILAKLKLGITFGAGRILSFFYEKCYPISTDAADIAIRFFGVLPKKINICSLGVDTDLFKPITDPFAMQARKKLRAQLGIQDTEIVCVYTGRFTPEKAPLCLAKAIDILRKKGAPVRGLFVGNGPEKHAIQSCEGCIVHHFVPVTELAPFYWAADIGVWPQQESTSQLDAVACGLPLIISDKTQVNERFEGNGLSYAEGDPSHLATQITSLLNSEVRKKLGGHGVEKIKKHYSWDVIAQQRIIDYKNTRKISERKG